MCRFVCSGGGWPLLLVYIVRKWGMSYVIVLKMEGTRQAQVFEVLYILHIHELKDVVYLCDKPNDPYRCAHLCLSNRM
jgi:hypothetical protein